MEKQLNFYRDTLKSPIGILELTATDKGIRKIAFAEGPATGKLELNENLVYQWVIRFYRNFFKSSRPDQYLSIKTRSLKF